MSKKYLLLSSIKELMTLQGVVKQTARGPISEKHLGIEKNQCMVIQGKKIIWTGKKNKLPKAFFSAREKKINSNIYPGFIDCHTHSLFCGDRKNEFELRNNGVSYQEIAKKGGGIASTVKATRTASKAQLSTQLKHHLNTFLKQGVTVVEVKTGYGLTAAHELRMLEVINSTKSDLQVIPTFLGAHAIPKEKTSVEYLKEMKTVLKRIAKKKLARRVDIFIEQGYFSIAEGKDYLEFAKSHGFDVCIHADQLTRTGAALLAAQLGALSTDHNIRITDSDIQELAKSNITCVLLPNADFYIHCPYPPARKLIDAGVRVSLSTDFNPGTSPSQSVQLVGVLARLEMKMALPEVFAAWTLGAAYALGLETSHGALMPNYHANFFTTEALYTDFFYDLMHPQISSVWVDGEQKV